MSDERVQRRGPHADTVLPAMTVPARSTADAETHRRVEEFLYHQADLLDAMRWADYAALFARGGVYWMPARPEQTTWVGLPSIFAEDIHLMEIRVRRLGHPRAWSQQVEWSTNHLVSNVRVYAPAEGSDHIVARSSFHMVELRGDQQRQFTGTYLHRLYPGRDGFEILLQRVDLLSARVPFDYVIQAWV